MFVTPDYLSDKLFSILCGNSSKIYYVIYSFSCFLVSKPLEFNGFELRNYY